MRTKKNTDNVLFSYSTPTKSNHSFIPLDTSRHDTLTLGCCLNSQSHGIIQVPSPTFVLSTTPKWQRSRLSHYKRQKVKEAREVGSDPIRSDLESMATTITTATRTTINSRCSAPFCSALSTHQQRSVRVRFVSFHRALQGLVSIVDPFRQH